LRKYLYSLVNPIISDIDKESLPYLLFDIPQQESHGDFSTNISMIISKRLKKNPREIATTIINSLQADTNVITKMEIAGPGFINFFFNPSFIAGKITDIIDGGISFGKSDKNIGKRANVEFVSANPTGPLTVGHGRNAVCGDTIANLLEWIGYDVDREYYFNNAGRQMRVLGDSVKYRYRELLGETIEFPDDYYQGDYIKTIAKNLINQHGSTLLNENPEGAFKAAAEEFIFTDIKKTLQTILIKHKIFYNENSLYEEGKIKNLIELFKEKDLIYDKDGATWLKLSEIGNEQDKVIIKSTGEPTYRLPDIAYHITKFDRNYDLIIDLFGSDHNATYPDVMAALKALGYPVDKIKVLIHQFVTITKDNQTVKMSTRKANYVTIDDLVEEVGTDVVRYFFNMRSITTHMNFDIGLAKKQSDENPVFYLQYAHARICSIMRNATEQQIHASFDSLAVLTVPEEQRLLKKLLVFPDVVLQSAELYEPHRIAVYLQELAEAFHRFYTVCRIIGSEKHVAEARLALASATKIVLQNGLSILGVSAPEKM
jgi:arginyl-tRNA synthetase